MLRLPFWQWPYTYDACDVGTVKNQTKGGLPLLATSIGGNDEGNDGVLSFQPGQRLSRCTCAGESHPGPVHENGEYVGRSAPEIDMFEAQVRYLYLRVGTLIYDSQVSDNQGFVSQSGQWAVGHLSALYENGTHFL